MSWPVIEVEIKWNLDNFKRIWNEAKILARDTKKELDKSLLVNLEINVASLQKKLEDARSKLRLAKKDLDKDAEITLRIETNKLTRDLTEAKRQLNNYVNTWDKDLSRLQSKFNWLTSWLKNNLVSIWAVLSSIFSIQKLTWLSEEFLSMQNAIRQVTSSESQLNIIQQKLLETANNARVPIDALTKSFVRFDLVNSKLWGTQDETIKMLDTLSKWLSMTWASATEVSSVMLQLSQAFWSWRLAGDEFRSVSENMPILLDILAKQLWVTRGELKWLAADWKITSEVLKTALITANEEINDSFLKSQKTIWQALTQIRNDFIVKFWELDKAWWITWGIVTWLEFLKNSILSFVNTFPWLTAALWWATIWLWLLWAAITLLWWPITIAIAWISALVVWVWFLADKFWFLKSETEWLSIVQQQFNNVVDEYNTKIQEVKKKQDELNKSYNEWKIWTDEYNKSLALNKEKLDELNNSQIEVKKWIDIVNDWQLDYIEKIKQINNLKLNTNEYNILIWKIKETQQELLKQIRLQQLALQSKTAVEIAKKDVWATKTWAGATIPTQKTLTQKIIVDYSSVWWVKQEAEDFKKIWLEASQIVKNITQSQTNELNKLKKAEADVLKNIREWEKIIKQPVKITPPSWWWTWWAKKQADDLIKIKEKELEEKARLEIIAIKVSELSELQKAKKIVEINKKLQRDLLELKWDTIKNEVQDSNEIIKIAEETEKKRLKTVEDFYNAIDKKLEESEKDIESYKKKVWELNKEFEKLKKDAVKNIQDINYEISKWSEETEIKLAERILKALDEQEEAQKRLNELKREWVEYIARQFEWSQETIKWMEASWVEEIWGIPIKDITEYLSLLEKQKDLQQEISLATKNSSEEIRNEIKRVSELSETEKLLEDQRKNEAILEERKKIYEAIRDWEVIILDEIQNYENQKLAEQLIAKQTELEAELELARQGLEAEKQWIIELYEEKKRIEKEYTNFFMWEIDKKVLAVRKLASEYKAVMSDISQTKAGQVINTNNNTNVWGINVYNQTDWESAFNKLMP
jgi:tape measure domain-containing protein